MRIYEAISNAMSEIGSIGKDKKNQQQGFMYRGVDDVMNNLYPIFIKHKIFCVPVVLEQTREERQSKNGGTLIYSILKVQYTFYTDDGSNVSCIVIGEGMDSADKASNKAMSVAFKYACFQILCIPTEEMKDPDAESHDIKSKKETSRKETTQPSTTKLEVITEGQIKRLYAISKGNLDSLKNIIGKFGYTSTKDILKSDYEKIIEELEKLG